ncbi:MAG: 4Fe-4S binding protein [Bacteroidales bacterium]|jgi:NADH-quinone oxidoreductase subunit I|nr:4Fe-4S binding protein [Bacteroidales bacterium]
MNHIKNVIVGFWRLLQGMYISMLNFLRPKVTERYPENRGKKIYFERFRGMLVMPHNAKNEHKCTACGICQMNCPNGTIKVVSKQEMNEDTGKPSRVLDVYYYDLGTCIYCALCTQTCPQKAIEWNNNFEHAVFERAALVKKLNKDGSRLEPKPAVPKPAATPAGAPAPAETADSAPTPLSATTV